MSQFSVHVCEQITSLEGQSMVASTCLTFNAHLNLQITCQHCSSDSAWGPEWFTWNTQECVLNPGLGAAHLEQESREQSHRFAVWIGDQSTWAEKRTLQIPSLTPKWNCCSSSPVQFHSLLGGTQTLISSENTLKPAGCKWRNSTE